MKRKKRRRISFWMLGKASEDRVKQIKRLETMAGDSMKAELKNWLRQRLHILRMLEK